ncbi:hypothetical protein [Stenotrophomonas indicatrix]|uniref:hypothetical protein n=1 Tax=Stenotrophomonas indicatrix TaxID=2045451 RepID=UPI002FDA924F
MAITTPIDSVYRVDQAAKVGLESFISSAKELVAFGVSGTWDHIRWQQGDAVAIFSTQIGKADERKPAAFEEPFMQFAKAYVRYRYSYQPVKGLAPLMRALRCVEAGLLSVRGRADILLLNGAVMDASAEKCRAFYSEAATHASTGTHLVQMFDFVRENDWVRGIPAWKSPFGQSRLLRRSVGMDGERLRASKLPSDEAIFAVADLFASARDAETKYFTAIAAILMAAPGRISEVLRLSVDCIQWERDDRGQQQMFLRWWAGKGKGPTKKWIVPVMQDVVTEAVRRLLEIGDPARKAARFAFDNPNRFLKHDGCIADPDTTYRNLAPNEFCAAVGVKCPGGGRLADGSQSWVRLSVGKKLDNLVKLGCTSYRDLARYVFDCYSGPFWPYIDRGNTVKAWDALCLHRYNEFHKVYTVKHFSWRIVDPSEVAIRFKPDVGRSLFDRALAQEDRGASIKVSTHQFRHWLSTMSERAGMDAYTLARWAGRASVADNCHYDHRAPEERLVEANALIAPDRAGLLERFRGRQPVSYSELGIERLGSAKATLYGMCVHDYSMAPCQKQADCITCSEHVCIKGDHVTLERLRELECQTELLLERAQRARDCGDFGADRWVDSHKWKLAHVRSMRVVLEQPHVPDGALARIPSALDPSPISRTLAVMGLQERPLWDISQDEGAWITVQEDDGGAKKDSK